MKILLVGGGSGGPVSPLLAIAEEIKKTHPKAHFFLIGTKNGPEKKMAEAYRIPFAYITVGKLRRYASLKNLATPFLTIAGFFQSIKILQKFRPDCVFGTGSFVQVPMVWAAWILKIPVVLHQQDVQAGLANKLCQFAAKTITVTFPATMKSFFSGVGVFYKKSNKEKVILTGNPFRDNLKQVTKAQGQKFFRLKEDLPTLLVLGGGTGAQFINDLILEALPKLSQTFQIIHSTGSGKFKPVKDENYHAFEFIDHMGEAYAAADFVLARAGLSTITELSNLKKISIIVPMPNSHQEINGLYLIGKEAAIVLHQEKLKVGPFASLMRKLLFEADLQKMLKENISKIMPHNSNEKIAKEIIKLAEKE